MSKKRTSKRVSGRKNASFSSFVADPVVALAILVFAFIFLVLSLQQFLTGR